MQSEQTDDSFTGSCLCGSTGYRITGRVRAFFHCHCSRCRKASGTGHASNVIVDITDHTWTGDADGRGRYDLPGAKRFHSVFCTSCGSPLPRIATDRSVAVIPAGSLDEHPPLKPTGRIFQDSRADWSCAGDGLHTWELYPT